VKWVATGGGSRRDNKKHLDQFGNKVGTAGQLRTADHQQQPSDQTVVDALDYDARAEPAIDAKIVWQSSDGLNLLQSEQDEVCDVLHVPLGEGIENAWGISGKGQRRFAFPRSTRGQDDGHQELCHADVECHCSSQQHVVHQARLRTRFPLGQFL
jgi:hypothetical protein